VYPSTKNELQPSHYYPTTLFHQIINASLSPAMDDDPKMQIRGQTAEKPNLLSHHHGCMLKPEGRLKDVENGDRYNATKDSHN